MLAQGRGVLPHRGQSLPHRSQALVRLPWPEWAGHKCSLQDVLSGGIFERDGSEMLHSALYVDLEGWASHFLKFAPG